MNYIGEVNRSSWPVACRLAGGLVAIFMVSCSTPPGSALPVASTPPVTRGSSEPSPAPPHGECPDARATIASASAAHLEALDAKRAEAREFYDSTGPASYPEYDGELQSYRHHRAEVEALAMNVAAGDPIPLVPRYRFAPWRTDETLDAFTTAIARARRACGESDREPEPPPPPPPPEEPTPDNWY